MHFQEYQTKAWSTALDSSKNALYLLAGLSGEVGEVCSLVAKSVRDGYDVPTNKMVKELGDVLWMVACLSTYYNIPFEEVAQGNLDKLQQRVENNTLQGSGDER